MKRKIIFYTGAGISAESGLKTFRDNDGLWNNYNVEDVSSIDGFNKNPKIVLDFYNRLRSEFMKAEPNEAHKIIASLEDCYDVTVVTQNIDTLHEVAGSTNVIHIHGKINTVCSSLDKNLMLELTGDIKLGDLHPIDNSQLRPYVVWFKEQPNNIDLVMGLKADIVVIVGTSMKVSPFNVLPFQNYKARKFFINKEDISLKMKGFKRYICTATDGMKMLKKQIDGTSDEGVQDK